MRDIRTIPPTVPTQTVSFAPSEIIRRQSASWDWIEVDSIQVVRQEPYEYEYRGSRHLLVAAEHAHRYDGETQVEGLPKSMRREFSQRLTFAPAGARLHGWQRPRILTRATYFYIDPQGLLRELESQYSGADFRPRLFFIDPNLWGTALKLKMQLQESGALQRSYVEALTIALAHELMRANDEKSSAPVLRGGLASRQQGNVSDYIEQHLTEDISLTQLAGLTGLSPYHFARAFKQSFGVPPHRYHTNLRMERAKSLLENSRLSVTEIGLQLGYSETSGFSSAFRKVTGTTPSGFRRASR